MHKFAFFKKKKDIIAGVTLVQQKKNLNLSEKLNLEDKK
jgi:hypothetical protein